MDISFYQSDLGTNRKWKICLCEEICGKHGVHHVSDIGPYLVVLRRIPSRYETIRGVESRAGLPILDTLNPEQRNLIIIDDLMNKTDQRVASLYTKKSHHRNISVMYIVQNLFHKGKYHRTISLSVHYMVLFKNPRDVSQI
jgi:hypothetical protein